MDQEQYYNMAHLLKLCETIAVRDYDGHFTLLRFTTNWRFCFGTIEGADPVEVHEIIRHMATGKTAEEAIEKGIKDNISFYSIYELYINKD